MQKFKIPKIARLDNVLLKEQVIVDFVLIFIRNCFNESIKFHVNILSLKFSVTNKKRTPKRLVCRTQVQSIRVQKKFKIKSLLSYC